MERSADDTRHLYLLRIRQIELSGGVCASPARPRFDRLAIAQAANSEHLVARHGAPRKVITRDSPPNAAGRCGSSWSQGVCRGPYSKCAVLCDEPFDQHSAGFRDAASDALFC